MGRIVVKPPRQRNLLQGKHLREKITPERKQSNLFFNPQHLNQGSGQQVSQGLSSHHEMCDWFLYFYTPRSVVVVGQSETISWMSREKFGESAAGQQCTNKGAPGTSWSSMGLTALPSKSYLLPELTSMWFAEFAGLNCGLHFFQPPWMPRNCILHLYSDWLH